ncbi:MAG: hypothetical protein AAGD04_08830 [Pseudomonadota bacterium]
MISFPALMLLGFLAGAVTGAVVAWRRKGKRADIIHYAFVWGIIGFIVITLGGTILAR